MTTPDLIPGPDAPIFQHEQQLASAYLDEYSFKLAEAIISDSVSIADLALASWSAVAVAQAEGTEEPTAQQAGQLVNTAIEAAYHKKQLTKPFTIDAEILEAAAKVGFSQIEPVPGRQVRTPLGDLTKLELVGLIKRHEYRFFKRD